MHHLHNSSSDRCIQWIWCSYKYVKCITGNTSDRCIKYDRNNPASTWNCDELKAILSNTGAKAYLYMLLGFILSIYLNLPMVVIGVVAVILALLQKDDNVQAV